MTCQTRIGWAALCVYLSAFYVPALLVVRALARHGIISAVFGTGALWALLEMARARIPILGFPWLLLGHATEEDWAISQIAEVTGVYGLSFLAAALNAVWAFVLPALVHRRATAPPGGSWARRLVAAAVLALLLAGLNFGRARVAQLAPRLRDGLRVALIQACLYQKIDRTFEERREQLRAQLKLHALAAQSDQPPDLICWAETAVPDSFNHAPESDDSLITEFLAGIRQAGVPTLFGCEYIDAADLARPFAEQRWYNSALLVDGRGRLTAWYGKQRLVPFGEYNPLAALPLVGRIRSVTQDSYAVGPRPSPVARVGRVRFGMNVCIEDVHPDLARESAWSGADAIFNVTNDAWFRDTCAPAMHLRAARLRAVELRRPLLRAANSGFTAQVDPLGRVELLIPPDTEGLGWTRLRLLPDPALLTMAMRLGELGWAVAFLLVLACSWLADRLRRLLDVNLK